MTLSNDPTIIEAAPGTPGGRQRAGLRVVSPAPQPNGVFVVVEMFVLVLVATLAMVSVIVSTAERADGAEAAAATRSETRVARDRDAVRRAAPTFDSAARRDAPGAATR